MIKLINIFIKIFNLFFILLFIGLIFYYLKFKINLNDLGLLSLFKILFLIFNLLFWIWVFLSININKKILVISYFSVIFSFYAAEYFLEKKYKFEKFETFLKENKNYDTRSKFDVYKQLKKKENNVVPLYYPYNQLIKKRKVSIVVNNEPKNIVILSGVSNSKTIVCNESGEYLIYESDKFGFNNPNEVWNFPVYAILLGDSMTLGECVKPNEDIGSILRNNLKKNIINFGMGGNGPLFQLAVLKEYYSTNKSKKIIWVYYEGNDLLDLFNEKENEILMKYLNPNFKKDLSSHQNEIDAQIKKIVQDEYNNYRNQKIRSFLLLWQVRGALKNFISRPSQIDISAPLNKKLPSIYTKLIKYDSDNPYKENLKLFEEILKQVKNHSINNNAEYYFVYLPSVARFNGEFEDTEELFSRNEVLKLAQKNQFNIIDTYENFFKFENKPLKYFPFNGKMRHFNSEGFRIISSIIAENIR